MRQLSKEERDLTIKGINRLKADIKKIEDSKEIYLLRKEYLKHKYIYEIKAIPYNMKLEQEQNEKFLEEFKEQIKTKTDTIKVMQSHLDNGVLEKLKLEKFS